MIARLAALVLLTSYVTGCTAGEANRTAPPKAFAALLANGTLVAYTAEGDEVARLRVGGRLPSPVSGAYIANARDAGRDRLVVIDAAASPNRLVVVDAKTWSIERTFPLPRRATFRNIAPGRNSGLLYVAGDMPTELTSPFGSVANAAMIAALDTEGEVVGTAIIRSPRNTRGKVAPYDWSVYSIAVDEKAHTIYVSYHGPNTSGADWVTAREGRFVRCPSSGQGGVACLPSVHGRVEAFRGGVLAATGTPPRLRHMRTGGTVEREWASGFGRAHLMEFARVENQAFGLESCPKLGGLTRVDLDRSVSRLISRPAPLGTRRPKGVCGERIAARPSDLRVAVAKTVEGLGSVVFIDGATGRIVAQRHVDAPPLDVATVG